MPNIKAIGDIDYDDFIMNNFNLDLLKKFQEISKPVSNIKYKLLLIKQLSIELKSSNIDYLISLANELEVFINKVEEEKLDINNLYNIVDDEYSKYWQKILDILITR